jgi:L-cysteine S-thiosulfotransferase
MSKILKKISAILLMLLFSFAIMQTSFAQGAGMIDFRIENDGISLALGGLTGDATRGRSIVINRQKGLCLLCHSGPFPEEKFQGNLAPSLSGTGARLTLGQIRLRVVNNQLVNKNSIMPAYYHTENRTLVARNLRDKTILTAQETEDVVAFIATLKE